METLIISDSRQLRQVLLHSEILTQSAQKRANDLATRNYFAHCDLDGVCPNMYARAEGCNLPGYYSFNGNNIESLVAGTSNPQVALEALAQSPLHADHLFGRNEFFKEQNVIGIGFCQNDTSDYKFYFAIHIGICLCSHY